MKGPAARSFARPRTFSNFFFIFGHQFIFCIWTRKRSVSFGQRTIDYLFRALYVSRNTKFPVICSPYEFLTFVELTAYLTRTPTPETDSDGERVAKTECGEEVQIALESKLGLRRKKSAISRYLGKTNIICCNNYRVSGDTLKNPNNAVRVKSDESTPLLQRWMPRGVYEKQLIDQLV